MITLQLQRIRVDSIVCEKTWSLHQDLPPELEPDFVASIQRFGILHPPVLRRLDQSAFEPVCGTRRLRAAVELLDQQSIDCLILPPDTDVADILRLVFEDQSGLPLSPIQIGRFRLLCRDHLDGRQAAEIAREAALGSQGQLDRLAGLIELEEELRSALHCGTLSVAAGLELKNLDKKERLLLLELFTKLGLNHNKQRRVIEMGRSVMALENMGSFVELLAEFCPDLAAGAAIDNPPQAANRLLHELGRRSSPMSTDAEQRFATLVAELDLPDNWALKHAKSFEQDSVTLEIRFNDIQEFRDRWETLKDRLASD